jgi:predicted AlkP superfamily pyrophosphatase or phosphodiesterase
MPSLILLSIPGLREKDVAAMPALRELTAAGQIADLVPSFPCVTCPVQAAMTTGQLPRAHGVVGNGCYWPEHRRIEMWTAPNECIERPQIWDLLSHATTEPDNVPSTVAAVWFLMHLRGCAADYVCTPAPIHNPDGSESLWCYTRPAELYGLLRDELGHFPLQHFWGPLANLRSTAWIAASAVSAARRWKPDFFMIYLPHLDYAAQRTGPDSPPAQKAVAELDDVLGRLGAAMGEIYGPQLLWLVAGEYAITSVDHVAYPNRVLRQAGLLAVREEPDGEHLDLAASRAWALADHQFSHVFVAGHDAETTARVAELFRAEPGIAEVLAGPERARYALDHPHSGDVVLISAPNSWQAYYYWLSDERAPAFARTVDIHRKPGYDPVELHVDPATKGIPLDATLVRGSHGAPARDHAQRTVLVASQPILPARPTLSDTDVFDIVLGQFGLGG